MGKRSSTPSDANSKGDDGISGPFSDLSLPKEGSNIFPVSGENALGLRSRERKESTREREGEHSVFFPCSQHACERKRAGEEREHERRA